MRKILGTLAALASLLLVGLTAGPANAELSTGYAGGDGVVVNISGGELVGGGVVNVKVSASRTVDGAPQPVVCNSVAVNTVPNLVEGFSGGGQASYDLNLDTEVVQNRTPTTITVTCNYTPIVALGESGVATASTASLPAVSTACGTGCVTNSNTVVLLPRAGGNNSSGILPTTGTEIGLWLLAVGGILVAGGAGIAVAARRRNA
ncbi:LPXTG cell wall anchor domain-containing protein [Aeromicrobium sp. Leaf350]|uniref:LPXTG cell wall anchor domain-containing protein n=1 Tax=Aeromicrobium sp. Leaf350 TaxID=2876565 RepID=UPI001E653601|nr:LPXTG cell wall anchor domain-containing protein [Aeromicrobium sp. Leaf350]